MNFTKAALTLESALGVRELSEAVADLKLDDVLGVLGLERKPISLARVLPKLGLITLSATVGAGTALLLAPTSGRKLRARLSAELERPRAQERYERIGSTAVGLLMVGAAAFSRRWAPRVF